MVADYTVEFRGNYIHIQHRENFVISPERMDKFWVEINEICKKYNCANLLAVGHAPKRRMDLVGAYKSGTKAAEISPKLALACCFDEYEPDEMSEFFKTVAANRGVRVEFFKSQEEALLWLGLGEIQNQTEMNNQSAVQSESRTN